MRTGGNIQGFAEDLSNQIRHRKPAWWLGWLLGVSLYCSGYAQTEPPRIIIQPVSQVVPVGSPITFSVTATGAEPLDYLWLKEGSPLVDGGKITGARTATLTVTDVQSTDWGHYEVQVTNAFGQAWSFTANLIPRAQVVDWSPGWSSLFSTQPPAGLTKVVSIAAGPAHGLALKADGTVVAWGYNNSGQTTVPAGLANVVAIAAGQSHSLALKRDGTVVGWGENYVQGDYSRWYAGQAKVPVGLTNVVAIAAGGDQSLALKADGTVVGWGDNRYGQPANLTNVTSIAAGYSHSLALQADGTVVAWGEYRHGETAVPPGLENVAAIAAGSHHSLALKADGTVVRWGRANYRRDKDLNYYTWHQGEAAIPTGLSNVVALAAGYSHNLALKADGTVVAWWDGSSDMETVPVGLSNVVAISDGGSHSLALVGEGPPFLTAQPLSAAYTGETVLFRISATGQFPLRYQWMLNGEELPGATNEFLVLRNPAVTNGSSFSVTVRNPLGSVTSANATLTGLSGAPVIVTHPTSQVTFIGGQAVFEVSVVGSVPRQYQWRFNSTDFAGATNRTLVLTNLTRGQAGAYSVRVNNALGAVTSSNATLTVVPVAAWGDDRFGQADLLPSLTNAIAVAAGSGFSLALKADGTVVAWGYWNRQPAGLTNVISIAAGASHFMALRANGTVINWIGGGEVTSVPPQATNVVDIAAGSYHRLALRDDGTVIAWGVNTVGECDVPAWLTDVIAIAAGGWYSLALKCDGTVVAWGAWTDIPDSWTNVVAIWADPWGGFNEVARRADGTLIGNGEAGHRSWFAPNRSDVMAFAWGYNHRLELNADGTVAAAVDEDEDYGQAQVPAGLRNVVAIAAGDYHSLALIDDGLPVLRTQPRGNGTYTGRPFIFRARASGVLPLSYQWQFNGDNLPGATNSWLFLNEVQLNHSGSYRVVITNALGSAISDQALLKVTDARPMILVQPVSQGSFPGGTATFQVVADGSQPLRFQWRFNSQDILGETNATLVLSSVKSEQGGFYSVTVSNPFGKQDSSSAILDIVPVVAWGKYFYVIHQDTFVPPGLSNVRAVAGAYDHSLALKADGTIIVWGPSDAGATNPLPLLTNAVAIAAGDFNNNLALKADGTVVTWDSGLKVPTGVSNVAAIAAGDSHNLALTAEGRVVAWGLYWNGLTSVPMTVPRGLSNVVAIAAGGWHSLALTAEGRVVGWGYVEYGQATAPSGLSNVVAIAAGFNHSLALTAEGQVVAWGSPDLTTVPGGLSNVVAIAAGSGHSLALKADGSVVCWGSPWSDYGLTNTPPGLKNAIAIGAGGWHSLAILGNGAPAITVQPFNQTVIVSNSVNLTALAVGTPPLSYQWQFNGTNVAGATNTTLELVNAQLVQAGDYRLIASNTLGAVTSRVAQLTVLAPPSLDPLPATQTIAVGADVTFSIKATGTPPFQYQWRKNGVNIPGATNDTLTLTNLQVADGGSYSVVVANIVAAVTSDPVLLLVEVPSEAPPEDQFVNRRAISGTNGFVSGTNTFATSEPGEPRHAGKAGGKSIWYTWQASTNGIATFRTSGSAFDTLLGIYTGTNVAELTSVATDEDRGGYLTSQVRFNATTGREYAIAVDGFAGAEGDFVLAWELEQTAEELPVIVREPASLVTPAGSAVTLSVQASGEGLTYQWWFNDEPIAGATGQRLELHDVQAEQVGFYTVRVANRAGRTIESLPAALELATSDHPASQDKWQDVGLGIIEGLEPAKAQVRASALSGGFLLVGAGTIDSHTLNNRNNTTSAGEFSEAGVIGGASAWLGLRPKADGILVVDTLGSAVETVLAVYQLANVVDFRLVASDKSSAADGVHSRVRLEVDRGEDYLVKVDGVNGGRGRINLNWALGQPPVVVSTFTNQVVQYGEGLVLSVGVTNANPAAVCQWWLNDELIEGATNLTLALTNLQGADAGYYGVLVSNAIEVVEQWVARVEVVVPELTIRWVEWPVGPSGAGLGAVGLVLEWPAKLVGYELEMTDNLTVPVWTRNVPVLDLGESRGMRQVLVDPAIPAQFFRLRKP